MSNRDDLPRLIPSNKLLPEALSRITGSLGIVSVYWKDLVGEELAKTTIPTRISKNTLIIHCASSSWAQACTLNKETILTRIRTLNGCGEITQLKTRVGFIPKEP